MCKPMNGSSWITREKRHAIYLRDNFTCQYCLRPLFWAENWATDITLDHWVPRSKTKRRNPNSEKNLVTACRSCNCGKNNRKVTDWVVVNRVKRQMRIPLKPFLFLAKGLLYDIGFSSGLDID